MKKIYPFQFVLSVLLTLFFTVPCWARAIYLFNEPQDISNWTSIETGLKDSVVKIEPSVENTTKSKYSMKLTYDGGEFPTVGTKVIADGILNSKYLCADITAPRDCVVGFSLMQQKSKEGYINKDSHSKYIGTVFLHKGLNKAGVLLAHRYNRFDIGNGDIIRFDIFMFHPLKGESIYIDNIVFSSGVPPVTELPWHDREWQSDKVATKAEFKIAGSDAVIKSYRMYGAAAAAPKDKFPYFGEKSAAELEKDMRDKLAELQKSSQNVKFAVFRRGDKGFDPDAPAKIYENAADVYITTHGPDGNLIGGRANCYGAAASETTELFMDHRSSMFYFDLSSIPAGSKIIDARFVVTKIKPVNGAGMFIAVPCNRKWEEKTANAFEYAYGKCWKELFAFGFAGEDPDFLPVILGGALSSGKSIACDFTEAVKYWTDGKNGNNGFHFPSDGKDYLGVYTSKNKSIPNRPALFVIYEPGK